MDTIDFIKARLLPGVSKVTRAQNYENDVEYLLKALEKAELALAAEKSLGCEEVRKLQKFADDVVRAIWDAGLAKQFMPSA